MRVQLNGEVIASEDQWLYDYFELPAFSPQKVRDAIDNAPAGEDLIFEINSVGGSVFAGFEAYSVLRNAGRRTVAEVQSLSASAASVVMLGCDEVVASPVAQVMIHLPTLRGDGNRYDHLETVDVLDSLTESILNAYTIKSGGRSDRAELKRLMRTSTWLTAPEAKALGLVDRISGEEQIDPAAILNCCGGTDHGIRSLSVSARPDRAAMLTAYQALVDRGEAPERPEMGLIREAGGAARAQQEPENAAQAQRDTETELQWAKARLELEKIRFGGI